MHVLAASFSRSRRPAAALGPLLLHSLTPRRLARQLLDLPETLLLRVPVGARRLHGVDARLLVLLRRGLPRFGPRDGADGTLRWVLDHMCGFGMAEMDGCVGLVVRLTSAAPLTYWAWPPMREGLLWSEDIVMVGVDVDACI